MFFKESIEKTYRISNINLSFIYHINSDNIDIQNNLKVLKGLSQNFNDILNNQNNLLNDIFSIDDQEENCNTCIQKYMKKLGIP